ncbi:MAG: PEGA domain-containing protein [Patescibacteria group bacterium]|nr:MAG: PEGA domain-containing protein [Patescibacteria group bacterium]
MNPRARRFLRWTFIATFFVLAPAVILSTAGYRYNFARGRVERTGVVVLDTRPTGASISLNGKLQKTETPTQLGKVTPGTYVVRVEKANYHPWSKTVSVGSRESVFLNQISLYRTDGPIPVITLGSPAEAAFSRDVRYGAAVSSASSGSELSVIDTRNGSAYLPYRSSEDADVFRLHWSQNGRLLLIERTGKNPAFLLWSAYDPERVRDLSEETGFAFTEAFWAQDADRLYGVARNILYQIDTELFSAVAMGASVTAPTIVNDTLYGIVTDETPSLVRRRLRDTAFETVAQLPNAQFAPVATDGRRVTYAASNGDHLFTIDPSGEHRTAFEGRGREGVWSADNTRLFYWNELELRIHDARTGTDELVDRLSGAITQAAWQRPEWNALYAASGTLYAIETTDRFGRLTVPLATFETIDRFAVAPNGDTAFIFGTRDDISGLWKLRLR